MMTSFAPAAKRKSAARPQRQIKTNQRRTLGNLILRSTGEAYNFLRSIHHAAGNREVQSGFTNHALTFFEIGPFKRTNKGTFTTKVFPAATTPPANITAATDPAEEIVNKAFNIRIGKKMRNA